MKKYKAIHPFWAIPNEGTGERRIREEDILTLSTDHCVEGYTSVRIERLGLAEYLAPTHFLEEIPEETKESLCEHDMPISVECAICAGEYRLPAPVEASAPKFKVGDRVKVTNSRLSMYEQCGPIWEIDDAGWCKINFDAPGIHRSFINTTYNPEYLELVETPAPAKEEPKFAVGDRVKVIHPQAAMKDRIGKVQSVETSNFCPYSVTFDSGEGYPYEATDLELVAPAKSEEPVDHKCKFLLWSYNRSTDQYTATCETPGCNKTESHYDLPDAPTSVDWKFRAQLAVTVASGMLSCSDTKLNGENAKFAKFCIAITDALIAEAQKGRTRNRTYLITSPGKRERAWITVNLNRGTAADERQSLIRGTYNEDSINARPK